MPSSLPVHRCRNATRAFAARALLCVCAAAGPAAGQSPDRPVLPPHLALDQWDDLDGLPQNTVHALAQGAEGYLWLGTQDGLVRFDGTRFVTLPIDSSGRGRFIDAIVTNPDTSLWIASGALLLLKDGIAHSYDSIPGWPDERVTDVFRDSRGRTWVGMSDGGIAVVSRAGGVRVSTVASPLSAAIRAFVEDGNGRVWIGASDGLAVADVGARDAVPAPGAPAGPILSLRTGVDGRVWAGTSAGLFRQRGEGFVAIDGLGKEPVDAFLPPGNQRTGWVAAGSRLFRLASDGQIEQAPGRLQAGDLVYAMLEDREGSLWLGTAGSGLARIRKTVVTSLGTADGLAVQNVLALLVDRAGAAWIGTTGGGLQRFHGTSVDTLSVESGHLPSNLVMSLAQSRDGSLWVGTAAGLSRIRDGEVRSHTVEDGLLNRRIRLVHEDRAGRLWLGGDAGLQEFRPDTGAGRTITTADGLISNHVFSLYEDADGTFLVGTASGLARIDGDEVTAWRVGAASGGDGSAVMGVTRHSGGSLWLATLKGIFRMDGDRFRRYGPEDGLCTDHAYTLVEDRLGRLWISSNHGLYWLRPEEFADYDAGRLDELPCRLFDRAAGMPSREANGGVNPSGIRSADGLLWFPTVRGVAIVDPERLSLDLAPPPPVIEELAADGSELDLSAAEIPASANRVSVRFTGLSFIASEQLRFRYRLEGYDRDWIEATDERTAGYTNLPPGRYVFRVAAAHAQGEWSEHPAELPLLVEAHFWETGWFRAIASLVLVLLIVGAHRWRLHRLDRRRQQVFALEQAAARAETLAVDARLRALRLELHPHFFFNTLNGISGLIRDGDQRSALDLLSRFADLTRATLQARHERTRPLEEEMDYIRQYLDLERIRFGDRLSIDMRIDGATTGVAVPPLLLQPLVENAVRHGVSKVGRDARLGVEARVIDGRLRMRVEDNGPGFDCRLEELPRGTGLRNVQERLNEIYGSSAVMRRVPKERGTLIEIVIPVSPNGGRSNGDGAAAGEGGADTDGHGAAGNGGVAARRSSEAGRP